MMGKLAGGVSHGVTASKLIAAGVVAASLAGCETATDLFTSDPAIKPPPQETVRGRLLVRRFEPLDLNKRPYCDLYAVAAGVIPDASCKDWDKSAPRYAVTKIRGGVGMSAINARNLLRSIAQRRSEIICKKHVGSIQGYASFANFGLGLVAAGLDAAGAVVTGGASKVLSAAALGVTGTRTALLKDIFQQQLASAVVKQIRKDRFEYLKTMESNSNKTAIAYNIEDALIDVVKYHDLCSLYSGLASLSAVAGKNKGAPTP